MAFPLCLFPSWPSSRVSFPSIRCTFPFHFAAHSIHGIICDNCQPSVARHVGCQNHTLWLLKRHIPIQLQDEQKTSLHCLSQVQHCDYMLDLPEAELQHYVKQTSCIPLMGRMSIHVSHIESPHEVSLAAILPRPNSSLAKVQWSVNTRLAQLIVSFSI